MCVVAWTGVAADGGGDDTVGLPVTGVFVSINANGLVEFNDQGEGEPVALAVIPAAPLAERARVAERNRDIAAVSERLAAARVGREQSLRDAQELRAQRKREQELAAASAVPNPAEYSSYFPRYFPRYFPGDFPLRRPYGVGRGDYRHDRVPYRLRQKPGGHGRGGSSHGYRSPGREERSDVRHMSDVVP